MNSIVKAAIRTTAFRQFITPLRKSFGRRDFTRTLWHMSKRPENVAGVSSVISIHKPTSFACSCGCELRNMHTKGKPNRL